MWLAFTLFRFVGFYFVFELSGLVFVSCLCFALFAAGLYRSVGCWVLDVVF